MYNDLFYGADLEVRAFGTFSIQITDAERFVRNFFLQMLVIIRLIACKRGPKIRNLNFTIFYCGSKFSIYYLPNFTITITSNSSSKPSSL